MLFLCARSPGADTFSLAAFLALMPLMPLCHLCPYALMPLCPCALMPLMPLCLTCPSLVFLCVLVCTPAPKLLAYMFSLPLCPLCPYATYALTPLCPYALAPLCPLCPYASHVPRSSSSVCLFAVYANTYCDIHILILILVCALPQRQRFSLMCFPCPYDPYAPMPLPPLRLYALIPLRPYAPYALMPHMSLPHLLMCACPPTWFTRVRGVLEYIALLSIL
jgi:hypothetical protein